MKIKTGIDIIEVERIKSSIESMGDKFLRRIFTENEIEYSSKSEPHKYEHFAARFAAKEAAFKAISELLNSKYDVEYKNVEVLVDENDRPSINFIDLKDEIKDNFKKIESIDISISHIKEYAIANVVLLLKED